MHVEGAGVTDREAEVLRAIGERLRNREIAERLHVSVRTVESHVAALLRKLGAADRAALVEAGAALRRPARDARFLPASLPASLTAPLTRLVGRDRETGEVGTLLEDHRLVTLAGPGGVGKTRLAFRVATDRFDGGVRLADLAPVTPDLVGDVVARALGVVPEPGWSLMEILADAAAGMSGLLIVDNCEHVVEAAADVVATLLGGGGPLRVLATSREPLGVPGEVAYQVRPLAVPSAGAVSAGDIAHFPAARLFVERAEAAAPGFALTDEVAPAVAALCQRVDGLPLAIELAASRLRTFGPVELVEHLDQRFDLLSAGARTAGPRHRTLRSAIDWSYELLEDDERALFDRLGVFPADFDYDAARAVHPGVLAVLPKLVDKSLVSTVGGVTRRYRLLESIRAYAAERLAAQDAEPDARRRHAAHYIAFSERAADGLKHTEQQAWFQRVSMELPNVRAALAHSVDTGDTGSAWRCIAALERFWDLAGQRREALDWIQRTLAAGDPPPTAAAVAGLAAASALLHPSDSATALDLAERARRLAAGHDGLTRATAARAVGMCSMWISPEAGRAALHDALAGFDDSRPWDRALTMQGLVMTAQALSEALQWGRDSVTLFRRAGDQVFAANTLFMMSQRAMWAGNAGGEVHDWLTESRAMAEAAGSEADVVHADVGLAHLAWARGDHHDAAERMAGLLPVLRRLGDRRCAGRAMYVLGEQARLTGRLTRAEDLLRGSAEAVLVAGQSIVLILALEALAAVAAAQERPRTAALLLGAAHGRREATTPHLRPFQPADEGLLLDLTQTLGPSTFADVYAAGRALAPAVALRHAATAASDETPVPHPTGASAGARTGALDEAPAPGQ
jgi:predicted ATPase/DNA-binding CsgD family transcriptional regulator